MRNLITAKKIKKMNKFKTIAKKVGEAIFSQKALRMMFIFLIIMSLLAAVDAGIEGNTKSLFNFLNGVLWVSVALMYSHLVEGMEMRWKAQEMYTESLETYNKMSDEHIETLKELVGAHETHSKGLEKQIENYDQRIENYEEQIKLYKDLISNYKNKEEAIKSLAEIGEDPEPGYEKRS
jgi:tetratricopeptide (TPR) repeat protein